MILNIENINKILGQYNLGNLLTQFEQLDSGFQSDNVLITTSTGKFVIKFSKDKPDNIEAAMKACEYLSLNGLIVPKLIRTRNNKLVLVHQDEVIVIQTFIEGVPYVDEDDNALNLDENLEFYGRKTGEFHKASLTMVEELGREIFRVGRSGIEYTQYIANNYMPEDEYFEEQFKQWEQIIINLPKGV